MTSSLSTLPQPSHDGDEGQSAGRRTSRLPGPKKAPSRVSDAEQQVVARYVDHDTTCDDAQPAEPRVMFEQPGRGLFCDSGAQLEADANCCGEHFEVSLSNFCDQQVQCALGNFNSFCSLETARHQSQYCGGKTFQYYSDCSVIPRFDGRPV